MTMLQQHYTDQQKIDRLISLGDCLSIEAEIEMCDTFQSHGEKWEYVCPTYGDGIDMVIEKHSHGDEEYIYTWDGYQWSMCSL